MTVGGYGPWRATDADRDKVHTLLQSAYADGRLTWDEFDSRSTQLMAAKTYDQLAAISADLRIPVLTGSPAVYRPTFGVRPRTNQLAIVSLTCGVGQMFFWLLATIPAIVCGHVARSQIRKTGEDGAGLALAGLILGYIGLAIPFAIVGFIVLIALR
jgi:hypothetical protein